MQLSITIYYQIYRYAMPIIDTSQSTKVILMSFKADTDLR